MLSDHLDVIHKALERYRARMMEVETIGWYKDTSVTTNEIARIDATLAYLDSLAAQPVALDAPELREALAEYAHEAWSGWMKYMFSKGTYRLVFAEPSDEEDTRDEWIMPAWAVERWQRQMNTPYADLPESEKASDRDEADKILVICQSGTATTAT